MMMLEKMRMAKEQAQAGIKPWHIIATLGLVAVIVVAILFFTGVIGGDGGGILGIGSGTQLSLKISRPKSLGTDEDIHHLHISEIEVYKKSDGTKLALSCANPCTNPMGHEINNDAPKAFDGDVDTMYHNRYKGQYDEANRFYGTEDHFLHVNIAGVSSKDDISKIKIVHKHPQKRRVIGATIELLSNGTRVWSSTFVDDKEEYEFTVA